MIRARRWAWLPRRLVGSVRVRVAVLAGIAFAITMVVASLLLLRSLESRLIASIRSNDTAALRTEASNVLTYGLPDQLRPQGAIAIGGGEAVAFPLSGPGESQPIVATASGPVTLRISGATLAQPAMSQTIFDASIADGGSVEYTTSAGAAAGSTGTLDAESALLLGVRDETSPVLVSHVDVFPGLSLYTASSLGQVGETLDTTRAILWWVVPALVLLVAGLAWLLAGRALRPVHLLTDRAAMITARSLHERVPVTSTGDEVSQLGTTINAMLDRIETADIASRRLVSDASHELRTPITVMRTELEVARRNPDAAWDQVSSNVLREVDRLQSMVDDLLLVARMNERGATSEGFSLLDTVRDVAARRRGVQVSVTDPDQDDIGVVGDGAAVRRALDHVVANAARHAASQVDITIATDGELLAVHVDDDGPGIAPEDRSRVLQRFERLDEGRSRDAGGSGLGLAVAHDVMAAHGGRVDITESARHGARVTLLLRPTPAIHD